MHLDELKLNLQENIMKSTETNGGHYVDDVADAAGDRAKT
jgi:hypothetical protein